MFITSELLREKQACTEQIKLFSSLFPMGTEVTEELCVRHAKDFNWDWATASLLPPSAREAYNEAVRLAYEALGEAIRLAYEAYSEAFRFAYGAYSDAVRSARERYGDATRSARERYDEATARAFARAVLSVRS
jgi:hypothetical protein